MHNYSIDLPDHTLRFSLPQEIVRRMPPDKIDKNFDPSDPSFQRAGFRELGRWLHDFNGPFWTGAYGSLRFHFMVRRLDKGPMEKAATPEELSLYLRKQINSEYGFAYEQAILNGASCTRRFRSTFGRIDVSTEKKEELEIFSFPLNDQMFLEVGFNIMEWVPGKTKSWKENAERLREAIKATVVLEPKGVNRRDR
jgi:hypothetical protein